jgi:hypothetical protein
MVNEFKLPEKWSIRVTDENRATIGKWRYCGNLSSDTTGYCLSFYGGDIGFYVSSYHPDYPEITFKQFKVYVLKHRNINKPKVYELW